MISQVGAGFFESGVVTSIPGHITKISNDTACTHTHSKAIYSYVYSTTLHYKAIRFYFGRTTAEIEPLTLTLTLKSLV